MLTLPNLLTLSRIAAIPLLFLLLMLDGNSWRWLGLALYTVACITDFFDGYIARRMHLVSPLGRFLDPIADKLLVASLLLALVATDHITGFDVFPALIILCREIVVSGLREFLAEVRISVPVTFLAKWKTTVQMVALGFLIVNDASMNFPATEIGQILLWAAAVLTLVTGYDYLKRGLAHIDQLEK